MLAILARPGSRSTASMLRDLRVRAGQDVEAEPIKADNYANGSRKITVCSRSGPVETIANGHPASSSSARK